MLPKYTRLTPLSRPTKPTNITRLRTHCKRGHELTEENLYVYGEKRMCRKCALSRAAKQRRKDRLFLLTSRGRCKREHRLNDNGSCSKCKIMLYHAKLKLEIRRRA